jgi:hypothetical protein
MFTHFFYTLNEKKRPGHHHRMDDPDGGLDKGYISSLTDFYYLARAIQ